MARSYVAIYQNKKLNYFIYYDFEKREFFKIAQRENKLLFSLIPLVSIVFYSLMRNVSLGVNINPFNMLLISSIIGITLGFISVKLTNRSIEKGLEHRKVVIHPTDQELEMYLFEGKKQLHILFFMMLFLLFVLFIASVFLLFMPQNVLMFLASIALWGIIILCVWAIRPIKRSQVRKQLEIELLKHPR